MAQFIVTMDLRGVEALTQKDINDSLRHALKMMVLRWRRRYLKKHFTKAGAREYGFQPRGGQRNPQRKGTYSNRKLRLFRHVLPNVYTGELRRLALQGVHRVKVTVTATRAKGSAVLPRKANFRLHELKLVSPRETIDLEQFLVERLEHELNRRGATATASVGISMAA